MTKPLAGKRYFDALGRSEEARGVRYINTRPEREGWPLWAKKAYCRARLVSPPLKR